MAVTTGAPSGNPTISSSYDIQNPYQTANSPYAPPSPSLPTNYNIQYPTISSPYNIQNPLSPYTPAASQPAMSTPQDIQNPYQTANSPYAPPATGLSGPTEIWPNPYPRGQEPTAESWSNWNNTAGKSPNATPAGGNAGENPDTPNGHSTGSEIVQQQGEENSRTPSFPYPEVPDAE